MNTKKYNNETDFVYNEEGSEEFKSVHVNLEIEGDILKLILKSKELIKKNDLKNIIKSLQADYYQKIKLNKECEVILVVCDKKYLVSFLENEIDDIKEI